MISIIAVRAELCKELDNAIDELIDDCKKRRDPVTITASLYYDAQIVPEESYNCKEKKERIYDIIERAHSYGIDLTHRTGKLSTWNKYQCIRCEYNKSQ
jgi:PHD/YefM family antitoxin component YafN of YafNO toxin-antitoxin module